MIQRACGSRIEEEIMEGIQQRSPRSYNIKPVKTDQRDGWEIALSYGGGSGPFLIDHHVKKELTAIQSTPPLKNSLGSLDHSP